jgi:hypothetical protein
MLVIARFSETENASGCVGILPNITVFVMPISSLLADTAFLLTGVSVRFGWKLPLGLFVSIKTTVLPKLHVMM